MDPVQLLRRDHLATAHRERGRVPRPRRPVQHLAVAHVASVAGNVVLAVAVPWLVLTTTGSAARAGLVMVVGVVGASVGGLAAARVVARLGAVRTSALSDVVSAAAVVPLPVLLLQDALALWQVAALVLLGSVGDSAGWAARQALVPATAEAGGVPRERANALFTSAEHAAYLVGAPLGGVLVAVVGVAGALWVAVVGFVVAAALVTGLRALAPAADAPAAGRTSGLRAVALHIWRDPVLRALVVVPTASVLVVGPLVQLVLPVLAAEVYGDPRVLGLMVACFGLGGLAGAAAYAAVGPMVRRRVLYTAIFVVWPACYAAVTLVPSLAVELPALVLLGAAAGMLVPLQSTVRQERAPAHLLAGVVSLSTVLLPVAVPLGVLGTGVLIDAVGLHGTVLLTSGWAALVGLVVVAGPVPRLLDRTA